jgi:hypothetical protein
MAEDLLGGLLRRIGGTGYPRPELEQRWLRIGRERGFPTWSALGQRALETSLQIPDEILVSEEPIRAFRR